MHVITAFIIIYIYFRSRRNTNSTYTSIHWAHLGVCLVCYAWLPAGEKKGGNKN